MMNALNDLCNEAYDEILIQAPGKICVVQIFGVEFEAFTNRCHGNFNATCLQDVDLSWHLY